MSEDEERLALLEAIVERRVAKGASSYAMACRALGITPTSGGRCALPTDVVMPYDGGDWQRCRDTFDAAGPILRERMRPVMDDYARRLRASAAEDGSTWRLNGVDWPPS